MMISNKTRVSSTKLQVVAFFTSALTQCHLTIDLCFPLEPSFLLEAREFAFRAHEHGGRVAEVEDCDGEEHG